MVSKVKSAGAPAAANSGAAATKAPALRSKATAQVAPLSLPFGGDAHEPLELDSGLIQLHQLIAAAQRLLQCGDAHLAESVLGAAASECRSLRDAAAHEARQGPPAVSERTFLVPRTGGMS